MKKLIILLALFTIVLTLSGCEDLCVGSECVTGEGTGNSNIDTTIIPYMHINGEGAEVEREGVLLFEYESVDFVKYQFSYLSCTCRAANLNYWQVMYIEIYKTGAVKQISFGEVDAPGTHKYNAGLWGDSSPTPGPSADYSDGKYFNEFVEDYIPWLVGKTQADLEGVNLFKDTSVNSYHGLFNDTEITDAGDLIDDFAGSSVSTNNMLRAVKVVLDYHEENYN